VLREWPVRCIYHVRFKVLAAVNVKVMMFCGIVPYDLVVMHQRFMGT
jgi:hypothetical protein